MSYRAPLHPGFAATLRRIAGSDVSAAEAVRRLAPLAERLGCPRPSYDTIRTFLAAERSRRLRRVQKRERALAPVLAGRVPKP